MNRTTILFLCLAWGTLHAAAAGEASPASDPPKVREHLLVSTEWLADHLTDPNLVALHVARNRDTYDKTHIPGAHFLDWKEIAVSREGIQNEMPEPEQLTRTVQRLGIGSESRIVIYDEEAGLPAARAYVALDVMGLGDQAALLDGQWKKWKRENRPVSDAVPKAKPSSFTPSQHPEKILSFEEMNRWTEDKRAGRSEAAIIDARPEAQYSGQEASEGVTRSGHIPGAQCVFSMSNVESADNPVMKPAAELRAMYDKAGVRPDRPVATYCRTGVQASLTYFALKYLGYDPVLYDGSFSEWNAKPDAEVEK